MNRGTNNQDCLYTGAVDVRYLGDEAGVVCTLATPRVTTSSCPKDSMNRTTFEVVTTTASFNLSSLNRQIDGAAELGNNEATVTFLKAARHSLEEFISENGRTNPYEAADWDIPVRQPS